MSSKISVEIAPQPRSNCTRPILGEFVRARIGTAALGLAFFVVLTILYTRAAWTAMVNSDNAAILLEASDAAQGNLFLHGWVLTAVSFTFTDLPFYILGVKLCGLSPALLHVVPAIIYALTVMAALNLASCRHGAEYQSLSRIATFLLIGLPALLVPEIVLVGVNHVGTALFMVLALVALDRADEKKSVYGLAAFGLLLTLTVLSDSMAVMLLLLPIVGVSLARITKGDPQEREREKRVLLPTLASFVAARASLALIQHLGGFSTSAPNMKFTGLDDLPQNALHTLGSLLSLYQANFFGTDAGLETLGFGCGLLGLGWVLFSLVKAMQPWRNYDFGGDRINQILAASMGINLLAYLLDFDVISAANTLYSPPERYLVPFFVFGAVLTGRLGITQVASRRLLWIWLALPGLAYFGFFARQLSLPAVIPPAADLGAWLAARNLHYGYGNYWCSSVVTAQTGGDVQIRPVTGEGGGISPLLWFSDRRWYGGTPAHFLVFGQSYIGNTPIYWSHVDAAHAAKTFGPPAEADQIGPYTVLIWRQDITPAIAQARGYSR